MAYTEVINLVNNQLKKDVAEKKYEEYDKFLQETDCYVLCKDEEEAKEFGEGKGITILDLNTEIDKPVIPSIGAIITMLTSSASHINHLTNVLNTYTMFVQDIDRAKELLNRGLR